MKKQIICIGETLIDEIKGERFVGGAPLNTAIHLSRMGTEAYFISTAGSDRDGDLIRDFLAKENLQQGLSVHPRLPTGLAKAVRTEQGERFEIVIPSAWNEIMLNRGTEEKISRLSPNDSILLYFGSLAMHFESNRRLLEHLISVITGKTSVPPVVFLDINIRKPFIDRNLALWCLNHSAWLKLNDQELEIFLQWDLADKGTEELSLQSLCRRYKLQGVILTKGEEGSSYFGEETGYIKQKASPVDQIADTIGAGDAFCAAFLAGLDRQASVPALLHTASDKAAEICSKHGAV